MLYLCWGKINEIIFSKNKRNIEPLKHVYSDICDLKLIQIRDDNKYLIIFIDYSTKYRYMHLLKSKDEALNKLILYKY